MNKDIRRKIIYSLYNKIKNWDFVECSSSVGECADVFKDKRTNKYIVIAYYRDLLKYSPEELDRMTIEEWAERFLGFIGDTEGDAWSKEIEFEKSIKRKLDFYFYGIVDSIKDGGLENYRKLDDGKYMLLDYGKYHSGVIFIGNELEEFKFIEVENPNERWNLKGKFGKEFSYIRGNYRISKKGNVVFDINENGDYELIMISWYEGTHGLDLKQEELFNKGILYYRRARSNAGRVGNDFLIVKKGWKYKYDLDI